MLLDRIRQALPFSSPNPNISMRVSSLPTIDTLYRAWQQDDTVFTRTALLRYISTRRYRPDWPFLSWLTSQDGQQHPYFAEWFFALASSMSELDDDHFFELNHPVVQEAYFLGRWSRSFVQRGDGWKHYCRVFSARESSSWKHQQWLWVVRQNHRLNLPFSLYAEDMIACMYPEMVFFSDLFSQQSWLGMAYDVEYHMGQKYVEPIDF